MMKKLIILAALLWALPLSAQIWYPPFINADGQYTLSQLLLPDGTALIPAWAWSADADGSGTGMYRPAANQIGFVSNGSVRLTVNVAGTAVASGAYLRVDNSLLTAGTMTASAVANVRSVWHTYSWTNAMVTALGAVGAGDITVATLPAKTVVTNMYVVINTPDTSANALTVACGRTGATYIDYIVASDAKAVANTVYGDASAERGANLVGYDMPSFTGTTAVNCHFIKTTTALNTVVGSTGTVYIETAALP